MKVLAMDERYFVLICVMVGLLSLLGAVLFPLLFTGLVYYKSTKEDIERILEEYKEEYPDFDIVFEVRKL